MESIFIGLGSNLNDPVKQLKMAVDALNMLPNTTVIQCSSLYVGPPMGPQDQPDYINAVSEVNTLLSAHALLDSLQSIEKKQGRVYSRHWGERVLDLDLLVYGDKIIHDEKLRVPHAGIPLRSFVLYPLVEIAPELVIPEMGSIKQLLKRCPKKGLRRLQGE